MNTKEKILIENYIEKKVIVIKKDKPYNCIDVTIETSQMSLMNGIDTYNLKEYLKETFKENFELWTTNIFRDTTIMSFRKLEDI